MFSYFFGYWAGLVKHIEFLRDAGLRPHRSANHGPITSFYYRDPDKNVLELCCNNFASFELWLAYFDSAAFKCNPSGVDIDFDTFIVHYKSGLSLEDLVQIP